MDGGRPGTLLLRVCSLCVTTVRDKESRVDERRKNARCSPPLAGASNHPPAGVSGPTTTRLRLAFHNQRARIHSVHSTLPPSPLTTQPAICLVAQLQQIHSVSIHQPINNRQTTTPRRTLQLSRSRDHMENKADHAQREAYPRHDVVPVSLGHALPAQVCTRSLAVVRDALRRCSHRQHVGNHGNCADVPFMDSPWSSI